MKTLPSSPEVGFAALLPHAPILVPTVGGARCAEVATTIAAMREVARACVAADPATVALISPHSPRRSGAFGLWQGSRVHGSLGRFGAPRAAVDFPSDAPLREEIVRIAGERGIRTWQIPADESLDHGAVVPLWFLAEAGWKKPVIVISLNYPGEAGCPALGETIARAAAALGRRIAVIASGDMSHRLLPGAPAGYHPHAQDFDQQFIAALRHDPATRLDTFDPALLECAAEDAVDSTIVALAACGWKSDDRRVLSYEGPFGVGYGVAVLFENAAAPDPLSELPGIARRSLEAALGDGPATPPVLPDNHPLAHQRAGTFVTLRDARGKLRGCVGTSEPQAENVVAETWHNARAAAFRDRRFPSVKARELERLRIEVSVLEPPEEIDSPADLDPRVHGVVVAAIDGRRGLLLPGIEGLDTAAEQIAAACHKAGISPDEPVRLQRFRVAKYSI